MADRVENAINRSQPDGVISHKLRYTVFRRHGYEHMDVILTRFCFYDLYSLILTQLSYHLSDIPSYLSVDDLSPIFGRKYYMVFAFPLRVC